MTNHRLHDSRDEQAKSVLNHNHPDNGVNGPEDRITFDRNRSSICMNEPRMAKGVCRDLFPQAIIVKLSLTPHTFVHCSVHRQLDPTAYCLVDLVSAGGDSD